MNLIIFASIGIQLAAAIRALRYISETGYKLAWIFVAAGLAGMVHRRVHTLVMIWQGQAQSDIAFELIGLAVSVLAFIGIMLIGPILRQFREANEKIAKSEERFRTVADFTYDWEYWRGADGAFIYMSPSCLRVTGYPREAFFKDSKLLERIIHPDDSHAVSEHLVLERVDGEPENLDFRIIGADGVEHWIAHRCIPVVDENGIFLGTRASNRLIDIRKHVEARLRKSRKLYQDLVEQSRSIVLELNAEGQVLFTNSYCHDFFGYSEEELKGKPVVGLIFPEQDAQGRDVRSILAAIVLGQSGACLDETEIFRKNGSRAWLSMATSQVVDDQGAVKGILCVGIDVTPHKAAEKLKDDVERIVRHDLKSPLMGIIGLPRLLQNDENITERQKDILKALEEAGMQMMDLINQSLTLYKLEAGTYDNQPSTVDWLGIVQRAARDLSGHKEYSQPIEIEVDGLPVEENMQLAISGDSTLLYGMAANLMKNALEAAEEEPVRVSFSSGDPSVMEIWNRGFVPEPIRKTFFSKYATSGKSNGTGLGTYSARLAVDAHKGKISMQTDEATGTVLRVEIPQTAKLERLLGHG